jgi:hypothetical protein
MLVKSEFSEEENSKENSLSTILTTHNELRCSWSQNNRIRSNVITDPVSIVSETTN